MGVGKRAEGWVDRLTHRLGQVVSWLALVMVLVAAANAVLRYLGRALDLKLSSNVFIESQWYLFSAVFLLGAAYTLQADEHVRVDVLYGRLRPKFQAWIDVVGGLVFLLPFCLLMVWVTVPSTMASWRDWEMSPDPGGLPRFPIKTLIPLSFLLLFLQGVVQIRKRWRAARSKGPEPHA